MHKIVVWAKEHPYLAVALGVGLLLVIYWLFFSGGSSSSGTTQDAGLANYYAAEAASAQTAGQVQQAQLAAQASTNQVNATADVQKSYIAAMQDMFKAQNDTTANANTLAAGVLSKSLGFQYLLGKQQIASNNFATAKAADVAKIVSGNQLQLGIAQTQGAVDLGALAASSENFGQVMETYRAAFAPEVASGLPLTWGQSFFSPQQAMITPPKVG